jgi:hypothetical protein
MTTVYIDSFFNQIDLSYVFAELEEIDLMLIKTLRQSVEYSKLEKKTLIYFSYVAIFFMSYVFIQVFYLSDNIFEIPLSISNHMLFMMISLHFGIICMQIEFRLKAIHSKLKKFDKFSTHIDIAIYEQIFKLIFKIIDDCNSYFSAKFLFVLGNMNFNFYIMCFFF